MQSILELTSEMIPLLFVLVFIYEVKKGDEKMKVLPPSIVALSIIEIPALFVTIVCMITHSLNSEMLHIITVTCFSLIGLIYVIYKKHQKS